MGLFNGWANFPFTTSETKRDYCCNLPHKSSIKLRKCKDLHDTHREKAPSNETRSSANKKYKYRHLGCWYNQVQQMNSLLARFSLGDKWRYLAIIFQRYLTIILKTSVIRFTYIKSEFWSYFGTMSDSEGKDILFLQLVVLFKMKMKKRRKRKKLSTRIIS